jgi:hypothetical protein
MERARVQGLIAEIAKPAPQAFAISAGYFIISTIISTNQAYIT